MDTQTLENKKRQASFSSEKSTAEEEESDASMVSQTRQVNREKGWPKGKLRKPYKS